MLPKMYFTKYILIIVIFNLYIITTYSQKKNVKTNSKKDEGIKLGTTVATTSVLSCNDTDCEVTSEVSLENITEPALYDAIPKEDETTTKSPNIVSTVKPYGIGEKPKTRNNLKKSLYCSCDLTVSLCDLNCCCDLDCNDDDAQIFSGCINIDKSKFNRNYCYNEDLLWRNNTYDIAELGSSGMFCIVKDNLPPELPDTDIKPLKNDQDLNKLVSRKSIWKIYEINSGPEFVSSIYKDGHEIWIIRENKLEILEIPSSLLTGTCLMTTKLKYLKNIEQSCIQYNLKKENAFLDSIYYFHNISVISSPKFFNTSWLPNVTIDCPKNICIIIIPYICNTNYNECEYFNETKTNLKSVSLSCDIDCTKNVLQKFKLEVIYNVTTGITKMNAYFIIKDLFYFEKQILQSFSVIYKEENRSNDITLLRSGNPGYLQNKPVLIHDLIETSSNSSNTSEINSRKSVIFDIHSNDITKTFLVLPKNNFGYCVLSGNDYELVTFEENSFHGCTVQFNINSTDSKKDICESLQRFILNFWSINNTLNTTMKLQKYVAMFGNANRMNIYEWVKVITNKENFATYTVINDENKIVKCFKLITFLSIDIIFAKVDYQKLRGQKKIIAVRYKFNEEDIVFDIDKKNQINVGIYSSVMFHDVSKKRHVKFADAPTFEIKLPHDFFYPFMFSGVEKIDHNMFFKYILVFIAIFRV